MKAAWALWLVALAAVVALVLYLKKQGVFGLATVPPAPAPRPAPPSPFSPGEFQGGNQGGRTMLGDTVALGCDIYTEGKGGRGCELAGRVGDVAQTIAPKVWNNKIGRDVTLGVATGGLYPSVKYGVKGIQAGASKVKGWFS